MNSHTDLFLGIACREECLAIVSIMNGRPPIETTLPATAMSAEAVRIYINDHEGPVGIAVDSALIDLALVWGRNTLVTITLVAAVPASHAFGLARYARNAL